MCLYFKKIYFRTVIVGGEFLLYDALAVDIFFFVIYVFAIILLCTFKELNIEWPCHMYIFMEVPVAWAIIPLPLSLPPSLPSSSPSLPPLVSYLTPVSDLDLAPPGPHRTIRGFSTS